MKITLDDPFSDEWNIYHSYIKTLENVEGIKFPDNILTLPEKEQDAIFIKLKKERKED